MTIDILTSVKDGEDFILQAIESVQRQTLTDWTYYVIDDGSTDGTRDVIMAQADEDSRIQYHFQESNGASSALNKMLKLGNAPFIAFIDADDLWHPTKLEKQLELLTDRPSTNYCFTMMKEFDEVKNLEHHGFRARKEALKGYSRISLLLRRKMLEVYGYFDESVAVGDFIDWLSEPINQKEELFVLGEILTYRRVHGNNMTAYADKNDYLQILKRHLDRKRSCLPNS